MQDALNTARLHLRRFTPDDTARVVEIQANWNVTKMLRMAPYPPSPEAIRAWLVEHQAEWAAGTAYRFAVMLGERLIGACDVDEIEKTHGALGYWYDEAYWGQGYAFEAAVAVRDFAFDVLDLPRLISGRAGDNPASGRVLTKLGFRELATTTVPSRSRGVDILQHSYRMERDWRV